MQKAEQVKFNKKLVNQLISFNSYIELTLF